jgi:cysteine-rich repeat protein
MSATYGKYYLILLSLGLFANCSPIPVCRSNAACGVGAQCVNGSCEALPLQPLDAGLPDTNDGPEIIFVEPAPTTLPVKQSVVVTDPETHIFAESTPITQPTKQSVVEKAPDLESCVGGSCQELLPKAPPVENINDLLSVDTPVTNDTWPSSDIIEALFPVVHSAHFESPSDNSQSIAKLTVKGMTSSPVIALPSNVRHIAYDQQQNFYYALQGNDVIKINAQGQVTQIAILTDDVSWPEGITFDSKNKRLVIGTFGGEGQLITYDLTTQKQTLLHSLNNLDLGGLAYDTINDRIFATPLNMGKAFIDKIYIFEAQGAVHSTLTLKKPVTIYGHNSRVQLTWVAGALALTIKDPHARFERVVLVNPLTGDVYGQLSDLSFPPSKLNSGVCAEGSSSNYSLAFSPTSLAQLYVIGVYKGPENSWVEEHPRQSIAVQVNPSNQPIVLFLSAYEPLDWQITLSTNAVIQKVFVTGFYQPRVFGLSPTTTIEYLAFKGCAYGWESSKNIDGCSYHKVIAQAREVSGLFETSYAGCYAGKAFVVENASPTTCQNGIIEFGEQCDDGNAVNDDYCSTDCQTAHAFPPALGIPGACRDGIDNDGDGNIDSADPACADPAWPSEAKVYVATDGADNTSRSGGANQSWRTIQFALANRRSATTILVKAGTYFECLSLSDTARHVRIKGLGAAILDGSRCLEPIVTIEDSLEPSTILSDLTLTNSRVGAVKLLGAATLLRLNITANHSQNGGSAISEGQNGHAVIQGCSVTNNEDDYSSPVYLGSQIDPFIENSVFAFNTTHSNTGVITAYDRIIFRHNQVINNANGATSTNTFGAGLGLFHKTSDETAVIFNNLFVGNSASGFSTGSALYVNQSAIIANNTFAYNISWRGPAIYFGVDFGEVTVTNNIVYTNETIPISGTFPGDREAIYANKPVTFDYNLFWNNFKGDVGGEFTMGAHNIMDQDPLIQAEYGVSPQSPAIDAGDYTAAFWSLGSNDQGIVDLGWHPAH